METVTKTLKSGTGRFIPKFLIPCMVRINKPDIYRKLIGMGYDQFYQSKFEYNTAGKNLVCECDTWHATDSDNHPHCVDCGENTELFLKLAGIRADTRIYVNKKGDMVSAYEAKVLDSDNCHLANKEEIVEVYKKQFGGKK